MNDQVSQFLAGMAAARPEQKQEAWNRFGSEIGSSVPADVAPKFQEAMRVTLEQDSTLAENPQRWVATALKQPAMQGLPEASVAPLQPNVVIVAMDRASRPMNDQTSRFVVELAKPEMVGRIEAAFVDVTGIPQTDARQFSLAVGKVYKSNPGAITNPVEFGPALRQAVENVAPEIVARVTAPEVLGRVMEMSSQPVDTRLVAPLVFAVRSEPEVRKQVEGNFIDVIRLNPNIKGDMVKAGAAAMAIADIIAKTDVTDIPALAKAIESSIPLQKMGINKDLAREAPKLAAAGLSRISLPISALPGVFAFASNTDTAINAAAAALRGMQNYIGFERPEVQSTDAAMIMSKLAGKEFGARDTMLAGFMRGGFSREVAGKLAEPWVMETVANRVIDEMGNTVQIDTAAFATPLSFNSAGSNEMIARNLGELDIAESPKIAQLLVDNSRAVVSRNEMRAMLTRNGISQIGVDRAVSDQGILAISRALRTAFDREVLQKPPGGIDINPALLDLLVKRDGNGIKIPMAQLPVKDTDIYGFEPVIFKIEQVDNLPAFIGVEEESGTAATARNLQ
jgi:hypothetical protein